MSIKQEQRSRYLLNIERNSKNVFKKIKNGIGVYEIIKHNHNYFINSNIDYVGIDTIRTFLNENPQTLVFNHDGELLASNFLMS